MDVLRFTCRRGRSGNTPRWQAACLIMALAALGIAGIPALAQTALPGTISGTVVDPTGASIARVDVKLSHDGRAGVQETHTSDSGDFILTSVQPGSYHLSFNAKGFTAETRTGELAPGQALVLGQIMLAVARHSTDVTVSDNQEQIAQAEIEKAEQQRLFGLVPNYFVTYEPDPTPLNVRQKFELTRKTFLDPAAFVITGIIAGASQSQNRYPGFGQGMQGYVKRYGASYANYVTGAVLERVVLTTLFKQDPRYYYNGTGSTRSRAWYAIKRSVICQGDNKKAQFCYSAVIGDFGANALTNYYYPAADRNSAGVVVQNAAIGIGAKAIANLVQEFVARKLTTKKP